MPTEDFLLQPNRFHLQTNYYYFFQKQKHISCYCYYLPLQLKTMYYFLCFLDIPLPLSLKSISGKLPCIFYFILIYFWQAICSVQQWVNAKHSHLCQHRLYIPESFCLLKGHFFSQQPAMKVIGTMSQCSDHSFQIVPCCIYGKGD